MDQAQVQKALMKEIFMEKISEMLLSQNKNNKMMTNESYQNIIRKLKLLNEKPNGYLLWYFITNN